MTKKIEDKEFIRCFFESESHRDMARKLGVTEQSVGQRVKRLRKRLGEDVIPVKPLAADHCWGAVHTCKAMHGHSTPLTSLPEAFLDVVHDANDFSILRFSQELVHRLPYDLWMGCPSGIFSISKRRFIFMTIHNG